MQIATYAQSLTMRNGVSNIQTQLADLQRQLSTGLKADSFSSLGAGRDLVMSLNNQIAQSNSYLETINLTDLRIKASADVLTRVDQIASEMKTGGLTSNFELTSGGQTSLQVNANSRLSELVDLLNTSVADRQLFSGKATQTQPVSLADLILNGDTGRAGLKQIISERNQADLGDGLGRLALSAPTSSSVRITEDAGPFGFKLSSAGSTLTGATVTGPTGSPATLDVAFGASLPQNGESISIDFALPDGTSTTIKLTATFDSPPAAGQFTIGADADATAANFQAALNTSLTASAATVLKAASTMQAGNDFFDFDASNPPQRVAGPPFATATALQDATSDDTVFWYKGDTSGVAGNNFVATIGDTAQMAYGARADQSALRTAVKSTALLAAVTFSGAESNEAGEYAALVKRTSTSLNYPNTQSVKNVLTDLGLKTATLDATRNNLEKQISTSQSLLDTKQNADPYEVATQLQALITQLQASYQVTATLSKLTLTDFI